MGAEYYMHKNKLFSPTSPESLGIPSSAILNFLERIEEEQINMHGFIVLRKGQIAAEGYWSPYSRENIHRMYSISKSFVSLAIGLLIDEGKLSLNDHIVTFFKDKLPKNVHPYLLQTTIRDLLMMASPHTATTYTKDDEDWAATFFNKAPSHPSGTIFSYDTSATVILNTIVEQISGTTFMESMRDKLLDPIGFSKDAWSIKTPEGTSWGGSGVLCTLRDMTKLAYVSMNNGRWGDAQLISEEYIHAATSKQIDNSMIHGEGYGYQIWREKDNGFSFQGMGSQLALCFPDEELIFSCIADTQIMKHTGTNILKGIFREEIFRKIEKHPMPIDHKLNKELDQQIESLHIKPQNGSSASPYVNEVDKKWFHLNKNPMKITRLRFIFDGDEAVWEYENDSGLHQLGFGIGKQKAGIFPQTNYFGEQIGTALGKGYDCLVSGAWVEPHKLNLLVYITDDHLGTAKISFSFKGNEISIQMMKEAEWFLEEYRGFAGGVLE